MNKKIYWILLQLLTVLSVIILIYPEIGKYTGHSRIFPFMMLFASVYILTYMKDYLKMFRESVFLRDKIFIICTVFFPALYCVCYVLHICF